MHEDGWTLLFSHRELAIRSQTVLLEYESELLGKRREVRIMTGGTWVWDPDARNILKIQHLASCHGADHTVRRPFHTGQASIRQMAGRPSGPPTN